MVRVTYYKLVIEEACEENGWKEKSLCNLSETCLYFNIFNYWDILHIDETFKDKSCIPDLIQEIVLDMENPIDNMEEFRRMGNGWYMSRSTGEELCYDVNVNKWFTRALGEPFYIKHYIAA